MPIYTSGRKFYRTIAKNLHELRIERGLSIEELAFHVSCENGRTETEILTSEELQALEQGRAILGQLWLAHLLAECLGVTLDRLLRPS